MQRRPCQQINQLDKHFASSVYCQTQQQLQLLASQWASDGLETMRETDNRFREGASIKIARDSTHWKSASQVREIFFYLFCLLMPFSHAILSCDLCPALRHWGSSLLSLPSHSHLTLLSLSLSSQSLLNLLSLSLMLADLRTLASTEKFTHTEFMLAAPECEQPTIESVPISNSATWNLSQRCQYK